MVGGEDAVEPMDSGPGMDMDTMMGMDTMPDVPPEPMGLPLLGAGSHRPEGLVIETLLDTSNRLVAPRGLAINPYAEDGLDELWVADADGAVIIRRATDGADASPRIQRKQGPGWDHFMPSPVALAFSDIGTMATVHETDWVTQDSTPADFMGPTLWTADADEFNGGWASHYDMLHNSPNSVGIAWDHGNAFWVFDGAHASITYYDFKEDHGAAGEDHSDGTITRWVEGEVARVAGVSSGLALSDDGMLYVADTGNGRIGHLDTNTGTLGATIRPNYDGGVMKKQTGASVMTLVDMAALGAPEPTGLALRDGMLFVSERTTSRVYAFSLAGETHDWLDLSSIVPAGQLGSLAFDRQGRLLVLDVDGARVLRISTSP